VGKGALCAPCPATAPAVGRLLHPEPVEECRAPPRTPYDGRRRETSWLFCQAARVGFAALNPPTQ